MRPRVGLGAAFGLAWFPSELPSLTESELLSELNSQATGGNLLQGLLDVETVRGQRLVRRQLRPDALAYEKDGVTWFEVDRSKRGPERGASLAALCCSIGSTLINGARLSRVIVLCKSERIEQRAIAVIDGVAKANDGAVLTGGRRHVRATVEPGSYEVWGAVSHSAVGKRTRLVDKLLGHIVIQLIPTWLPKVRLDARNKHPLKGWLNENYLPYRRPVGQGEWPQVHPTIRSAPQRPSTALEAGSTDKTLHSVSQRITDARQHSKDD